MAVSKRLSLGLSVKDLFMVGKTYASRLEKLGIFSVEDLLHHYPFRYEDFRIVSKVGEVQVGEKVTLRAKVVSCQNVFTRHGKKLQKAVIADSSGQMEVVWFNQPYITNILKPGVLVSLSGKVDSFSYKSCLISPEYEVLKEKDSVPVHTSRLVPVYPETYGLSSKWLRSRTIMLLDRLVNRVPDWLPEGIRKKEKLIDLQSALKKIHFPENEEDVKVARKRLKFDELFLIQLNTLLRKSAWVKNKTAFCFKVDQEKVLAFISSLPFTLTSAQNRAVKEILSDLKKKIPMNRLLEGDVGSGKTVVAAVAAYLCYLNGFQSALMAPTEILAQQHYQTIKALLSSFGLKISLLTGSKRIGKKQRKEIESADVFIGTHALIYDKVKIEKLGLVIIDEQHRFGVEQRAKLIRKGKAPHILTMTATPIPRSIALTLYGDLDLSVLNEMPPGRRKIKTWVVNWQKRNDAYNWIEKEIKKEKSQAFIVCPLIEESEKESMKDIKAATVEFERLSKVVFPKLKLGLLHGRIKPKEKEKIIKGFKDKRIDVLVSTPVVEVGIDVPNATIMLIEGSDRFGLAQLHQLRGRVGRSSKQSYCLLFVSSKNKENLTRLKAMEKHNSGFKLAEIDLQLRGPGELYGTSQHGFTKLKIASFADTKIIEKTKKEAEKTIKKLKDFPLLKQKLKKYTIRDIEPN